MCYQTMVLAMVLAYLVMIYQCHNHLYLSGLLLIFLFSKKAPEFISYQHPRNVLFLIKYTA